MHFEAQSTVLIYMLILTFFDVFVDIATIQHRSIVFIEPFIGACFNHTFIRWLFYAKNSRFSPSRDGEIANLLINKPFFVKLDLLKLKIVLQAASDWFLPSRLSGIFDGQIFTVVFSNVNRCPGGINKFPWQISCMAKFWLSLAIMNLFSIDFFADLCKRWVSGWDVLLVRWFAGGALCTLAHKNAHHHRPHKMQRYGND